MQALANYAGAGVSSNPFKPTECERQISLTLSRLSAVPHVIRYSVEAKSAPTIRYQPNLLSDYDSAVRQARNKLPPVLERLLDLLHRDDHLRVVFWLQRLLYRLFD
jgi:hypothetical protein